MLGAGDNHIMKKSNRRELMQAAALFAPFALPAAAADALANSVVSPSQAKHKVEAYGESWSYFSGATAQFASVSSGSIRLKPGMAPHPPHTHPEEEFVLVTEGTGELSIEGKKTQAVQGSMMFCAADRTHGIVNTGKTPMTFYYWKWKR
jgi:quercetin dioxygenase-like cupin family protein